MTMGRLKKSVERHLRRTTQKWNSRVRDPRHRKGRRWSFGPLMNAAWAGVLSASENLRHVEALTERMGTRVADSTLHDLLVALSAKQLGRLLVAEVRAAQRAKEIASALPFSVVAVDGKAIWSGNRKANRYCQRQRQEGGGAKYVMRVLRAALVGSPCRVVIGQRPVPAKGAETSTFPAFFRDLLRDYGRSGLLDVLTLDAGYISEKNARLIDAAGRGYVMALKNPQKELVDEARRLLAKRERPDAETDWERYNGVRIRRRLYRSVEIAGYNEWKHLREVWLVRQETESADGTVKVEERYFVTNLPPGRTRSDLPLRIVRAHWGIENHANWTMDMVWKEDRCPWVAAAVEVVALMRLLAFNVVMRLRARHLRTKENRRRTWRNLIDLVTDVVLCRTLRGETLFGANERGLAVFG